MNPKIPDEIMGANGQFVWWVGIVLDRFDPWQLGRVRVYIKDWSGIGFDSGEMNKVYSRQGVWAQPILPVTSGAIYGVGQTANMVEGTHVFGFFMDGVRGQVPMILGVMSSIQKDIGQDKRNSITRGNSPKRIRDIKTEDDEESDEFGEMLFRHENTSGDSSYYRYPQGGTAEQHPRPKHEYDGFSVIGGRPTSDGANPVPPIPSSARDTVTSSPSAESIHDVINNNIIGGGCLPEDDGVGAFTNVPTGGSFLYSDLSDSCCSDLCDTYEGLHESGFWDFTAFSVEVPVEEDDPYETSGSSQKPTALEYNLGDDPGKGCWVEPQSPHATVYPFNNVHETESGHVFEMDDTPEAELIALTHRTTSQLRFDPDGSYILRSVNDSYHVTNGYMYESSNKGKVMNHPSYSLTIGSVDVEFNVGDDEFEQVGITLGTGELQEATARGRDFRNFAADMSLTIQNQGAYSVQSSSHMTLIAGDGDQINFDSSKQVKGGGPFPTPDGFDPFVDTPDGWGVSVDEDGNPETDSSGNILFEGPDGEQGTVNDFPDGWEDDCCSGEGGEGEGEGEGGGAIARVANFVSGTRLGHYIITVNSADLGSSAPEADWVGSYICNVNNGSYLVDCRGSGDISLHTDAGSININAGKGGNSGGGSYRLNLDANHVSIGGRIHFTGPNGANEIFANFALLPSYDEEYDQVLGHTGNCEWVWVTIAPCENDSESSESEGTASVSETSDSEYDIGIVSGKEKVVLADASSNDVNTNLPDATNYKNSVVTVKRTDNSGNSVKVATSGGQTIDGDATQTLGSQYSALRVVSDGNNWMIT